MEFPRDSSEIKIALSCPVCSGNGGIGTRLQPVGFATSGGRFDSCATCSGTGWIHKRIKDLSDKERERVLLLLQS